MQSAKVLTERCLPDPNVKHACTPEVLFKEIGEEFVTNKFSDEVYRCLFPVSVLPDEDTLFATLEEGNEVLSKALYENVKEKREGKEVELSQKSKKGEKGTGNQNLYQELSY